MPASSREELLSAPTAELELFDRSCSTPVQLCQRKKARSASSPPPPYPTLPSRLIIMMLMMMMIETKRCRKRPNISKQAYEPLLSTTKAAMAEEEEEKSALARFSCFPRANAAGKARLNADCWCRKTNLIHRVLLFLKSQKRTSEQKGRKKKKVASSSNQKYTNTKHNNNIKPPKIKF